MTTEKPTPETDAFIRDEGYDPSSSQWARYARRLERERDEYKVWWERDSTALGKVIGELHTSRAVCEDWHARAVTAEAERDDAVKQMEAGWIRVCETPIAELKRENEALAARLAEVERDASKMREWCDSMRRYGAENKSEAMLAIVAEMQAYSIRNEAIDAAIAREEKS